MDDSVIRVGLSIIWKAIRYFDDFACTLSGIVPTFIKSLDRGYFEVDFVEDTHHSSRAHEEEVSL